MQRAKILKFNIRQLKRPQFMENGITILMITCKIYIQIKNHKNNNVVYNKRK